jgi:hypothetical protein
MNDHRVAGGVLNVAAPARDGIAQTSPRTT